MLEPPLLTIQDRAPDPCQSTAYTEHQHDNAAHHSILRLLQLATTLLVAFLVASSAIAQPLWSFHCSTLQRWVLSSLHPPAELLLLWTDLSAGRLVRDSGTPWHATTVQVQQVGKCCYYYLLDKIHFNPFKI